MGMGPVDLRGGALCRLSPGRSAGPFVCLGRGRASGLRHGSLCRGIPPGVPPAVPACREKPPSVPPTVVPRREKPCAVPSVTAPRRENSPGVPPAAVSRREKPPCVPHCRGLRRGMPPGVPPTVLERREMPPSVPPVAILRRENSPGVPFAYDGVVHRTGFLDGMRGGAVQRAAFLGMSPSGLVHRTTFPDTSARPAVHLPAFLGALLSDAVHPAMFLAPSLVTQDRHRSQAPPRRRPRRTATPKPSRVGPRRQSKTRRYDARRDGQLLTKRCKRPPRLFSPRHRMRSRVFRGHAVDETFTMGVVLRAKSRAPECARGGRGARPSRSETWKLSTALST